jgi:hypothetical protein
MAASASAAAAAARAATLGVEEGLGPSVSAFLTHKPDSLDRSVLHHHDHQPSFARSSLKTFGDRSFKTRPERSAAFPPIQLLPIDRLCP